MAITVLTLDELRANAVAALRVRFPTRDTSAESLLGKLGDAIAGFLWDLHARVQAADLDAVPQESSTYAALALWAYVLGLPDGAGGYGAKGAILATGGQGLATGTPGNPIGGGTQLVAGDGETLFEVAAGVVVGVGGTVTIDINALTAGAAGNLEVGDTLTFVSPPAGILSTVTITGAISGGADKETATDLLARILYRLQYPPKAITASDLRELAEGVTGIVRAYVYPRRPGTGGADVVVVQSGTGTGRVPASVTDVQTALDDARNVGAEGITAYAPTTQTGHVVRVRLTPQNPYTWDWDSSGGAWQVAGYVAGPPGVLTLDVAAPADFQAAVLAAEKPRVQIVTTNVVLPQVARVTAYNAGTFECTLEEPLDVAPVNGDAVHAGAVFVVPIATAILALCDGLGPSRVSDHADPLDYWDDTLRLDQIRRVALDTADAQDRRYALALVVAPTIDGGGADIQADDSLTVAPELLFLDAIAVTP